jgi:hypothetical protein
MVQGAQTAGLTKIGLPMRQFSYDAGMRVISIEEFQDKGWRWAAEEARKVIDRPRLSLVRYRLA